MKRFKKYLRENTSSNMKSFKKFIFESNLEIPGSQEFLHSPPPIGSGNIFTKAAGYEQKRPEEYNPEHSAMIHMTSHFPLGGIIETSGSHTYYPRETVHFTRNGTVSSHMFGNWNASKFGIMIPEHKVSDRLFNHGSHDSFAIGNVSLPHGSRIVMNWSNLEDHEKDHIKKLTGSNSHDEALKKINKGHSINFGDNQIQLHSTQGSESNHDAVRRHLTASGINPVNIGHNYATGYLNPDSSDAEFDSRYGLRGSVSNFYINRSKRGQDKIESKAARPSTGDHIDSIFADIESNTGWRYAGHTDYPLVDDTKGKDSEYFKKHSQLFGSAVTAAKHSKVIRDILQNPERYHPTAYTSPESKEALQRLLRKIDHSRSGGSPTEAGPSIKQGIQNRKERMIKANKL